MQKKQGWAYIKNHLPIFCYLCSPKNRDGATLWYGSSHGRCSAFICLSTIYPGDQPWFKSLSVWTMKCFFRIEEKLCIPWMSGYYLSKKICFNTLIDKCFMFALFSTWPSSVYEWKQATLSVCEDGRFGYTIDIWLQYARLLACPCGTLWPSTVMSLQSQTDLLRSWKISMTTTRAVGCPAVGVVRNAKISFEN